jgi:hypothetical protein
VVQWVNILCLRGFSGPTHAPIVFFAWGQCGRNVASLEENKEPVASDMIGFVPEFCAASEMK